MNLFYLTKSTILCGGSAFLIYSFPVISQVVIISLLSLLWLSCAHRTITRLRRREALQQTTRTQGGSL